MRQFAEDIFRVRQKHVSAWPSMQRVHAFVDDLRGLLFPHVSGDCEYYAAAEIEGRLAVLGRDLKQILRPQQRKLPASADETAERFMQALPEIYRALWLDARAIHEGDPASESVDEVIAAYPGFFAVYAFRIAHQLHADGVPILPRIISEHAHLRTGVDIHPGAQIGRRFCIDHGTGVVIGETTEIGDWVKLYQGVTLGALSFPTDGEGNLVRDTKRHPTIEDRVVIYANATVLGGQTIIGHDAVIGSSVWVVRSIEPNTTVTTEEPQLRLREK